MTVESRVGVARVCGNERGGNEMYSISGAESIAVVGVSWCCYRCRLLKQTLVKTRSLVSQVRTLKSDFFSQE